jgi:hypothetical protein
VFSYLIVFHLHPFFVMFLLLLMTVNTENDIWMWPLQFAMKFCRTLNVNCLWIARSKHTFWVITIWLPQPSTRPCAIRDTERGCVTLWNRRGGMCRVWTGVGKMGPQNVPSLTTCAVHIAECASSEYSQRPCSVYPMIDMVLDTGFAVGLSVAAILWHWAFFKVILAQWIRSPCTVAGHICGSGDVAKCQIFIQWLRVICSDLQRSLINTYIGVHPLHINDGQCHQLTVN